MFKNENDRLNELYKQVFGFNRIRKDLQVKVRKILSQIIVNQSKIDYNYYLNKNCPLPEDWASQKQRFISEFGDSKSNMLICRVKEGNQL